MSVNNNDKKFLVRAIELARESVEQGGFPAGALVVKDGEVVSEAVSTGFKQNDPTGHAESKAIREACIKLETANLKGTTLYGSLQSCLMCFSSAYWAGVDRMVYAVKKTPEMVKKFYYEGMTDPEQVNSQNNRNVELVYISEMEADSLKVVSDWENKGGFGK